MKLRSNRPSSCALVLGSLLFVALAACGDDDVTPGGDAGPGVDPCPAGYRLSSAPVPLCEDLDECALGTDDCADNATGCTNTLGGFTCGCPAGFVGTGHGADGCLADDPSLAGLSVGAGALLSPAFSADTTTYEVTLAHGDTATTLTPTVAEPARTTITVAGAAVASGVSAPVDVAFAPRVVEVVTTTESGATRVYTVVFARSAAVYVKASNPSANDHFGMAVSLSADGTRLAVGASFEASSATGVGGDQANDAAPASGAVYVFARTGATWAQEAYLKASNAESGDRFGSAVSLSADGTRLAVGAACESSSATGVGGDSANDAAACSGAVYVFARTGTTWAEEAYVKASNTAANDGFGAVAVSLAANGTRLAVGAAGEASSATGVGGDGANDTAVYAGAVYVFARTGTTWAQEAYVKASNTDARDEFGATSVALSADGAVLAVGARGEDSSATGVNGDEADDSAANSGAAYVFTRTGTVWAQQAYVKASNTGAGDCFGDSGLALSADGTRLAVGGVTEASAATGIGGDQSNDGAADSGAVYVFARTGTTWAQEAYVKASNTQPSAYFGVSVSFSADGSRLAVGAYGDLSSATGIGGDQADTSAPYSGAVYVFARTGATWAQEAYVKAPNTATNDALGFDLSFSADGTRLAIGADGEDSSATGIDGDSADDGTANSGAVFVY
jgi:hypothetical protein